MSRKLWSPTENEAFYKMAKDGMHSNKYMAEFFQTSVQSVTTKKNRAGIVHNAYQANRSQRATNDKDMKHNDNSLVSYE